ncbi:PilZ domain-containing protein [Paenibacillus sp. CAU 1782]
MTINRRQTPFRYVFKEPIAFELRFLSINGVQTPSKPVKAVLHNISKSGCCVWLPLLLPIEDRKIAVSLELVLNEELLTLVGELRWSLPDDEGNRYGIELSIPEQDHDLLPRELRELAGQGRIIAV